MYPVKLIFSTINNQIKQFMINDIKERDKADSENESFSTVPYIVIFMNYLEI